MRLLAITALCTFVLGTASARALSLEPIGEFEEPTYVTSDPGNPNRLFVVERRGKIELDEGGSVSTFADLTSLVGCPSGCTGERGLMSIALAPDFTSSGHLYVDYIDNSSGEIHVDELTASGNTAALSTRRPLLGIPHSQASNHNGGQLQIGPDGGLYISTGDGGGGNDQFHHSQDPSSMLGKLLRIDPAQSNPPVTVWSLGLRNPFRFSFDRLTGDLVIGDVGQGAREEVDFAPSPSPGVVGGQGANYGWNCREGFLEGPADDLPGEGCEEAFESDAFVDPVFDYPHADPGGGVAHGCAIIGGYVVRDESLGDLYGRYVYGDLCVGEIRSLLLPTSAGGIASGDRSEGLIVSDLNSFGEDSCGRIYAVSGDGDIYRLEGASAGSCPPSEPPSEPPGKPSPPPPERPVFEIALPVPTTVRLSADERRVRAGARASLTATVLPCTGRDGQRIQLNRGGRKLATAPLDDGCTAQFHPRIAHRSTFRIVVPASAAYLLARSAQLTIDVR